VGDRLWGVNISVLSLDPSPQRRAAPRKLGACVRRAVTGSVLDGFELRFWTGRGAVASGEMVDVSEEVGEVDVTTVVWHSTRKRWRT
jgi:hypothetical protein